MIILATTFTNQLGESSVIVQVLSNCFPEPLEGAESQKRSRSRSFSQKTFFKYASREMRLLLQYVQYRAIAIGYSLFILVNKRPTVDVYRVCSARYGAPAPWAPHGALRNCDIVLGVSLRK